MKIPKKQENSKNSNCQKRKKLILQTFPKQNTINISSKIDFL